MSLPADFLPAFADCTMHRDANAVFHELWQEEIRYELAEALRITHCRIIEDREKPITTGITRTRRDNSDVHDPSVRSWARLTGYVMPRSGRVTNEVRDAYRIAHDMPVSVGPPDTPEPPVATRKQITAPTGGSEGISIPAVREWCQENGIPVGARGRLKPEIIERYKEAHS